MQPISKRELEEVSDKLLQAFRGHRTACVVAVLSRMLPLYWCTSRQFNTVTDALDMWRDHLSPEMENTIRRAFGDIRYGTDE